MKKIFAFLALTSLLTSSVFAEDFLAKLTKGALSDTIPGVKEGIHFLVGLGVNVGLGWIDYDCLFLLARMNVILEINFLSRYVV
ncbi:hypothetical protein LAE74_08995 [Campylobacter coli]|uniref:hypothetical protein n=1 Tax=Campylobacter coli TaxID=195 RepID=UPI001CC7A5D2|nr:hypothetical protein [Campylobacter coli]UAY59175.1 hypothetical protein LAE74_08995 [Campylobacter coli]